MIRRNAQLKVYPNKYWPLTKQIEHFPAPVFVRIVEQLGNHQKLGHNELRLGAVFFVGFLHGVAVLLDVECMSGHFWNSLLKLNIILYLVAVLGIGPDQERTLDSQIDPKDIYTFRIRLDIGQERPVKQKKWNLYSQTRTVEDQSSENVASVCKESLKDIVCDVTAHDIQSLQKLEQVVVCLLDPSSGKHFCARLLDTSISICNDMKRRVRFAPLLHFVECKSANRILGDTCLTSHSVRAFLCLQWRVLGNRESPPWVSKTRRVCCMDPYPVLVPGYRAMSFSCAQC